MTDRCPPRRIRYMLYCSDISSCAARLPRAILRPLAGLSRGRVMTASTTVPYMRGSSLAALLLCTLLAVRPLAAQTSDSAAATQPTAAEATAPAGAEQVEAKVIDLKGRAQHAPVGSTVTDTQAWQPVQLNDVYPAGTLIRTSLSSHVTLQFGSEEPYTVVMVERMTLASLASLYKTAHRKGQPRIGQLRRGPRRRQRRRPALQLRCRQHRRHAHQARHLGLPPVRRTWHRAVYHLAGRQRPGRGPQQHHAAATGPLPRPVRHGGHDPLGRPDQLRPVDHDAGPLRPDGR